MINGYTNTGQINYIYVYLTVIIIVFIIKIKLQRDICNILTNIFGLGLFLFIRNKPSFFMN